ncbi:MAG: branched chain amino acid aminotransferase [Pseudomonadota bacterium]|jgi:branched-chain amino acid aminotransferase
MADGADSKVIWMDGELVPFDAAKVHVLSHSLHYGSAAFEGIRAYETSSGRTAIFRAEEHMERFRRSTRIFGSEVPFSNSALTEATATLIRANGFKSCYIRPLSYIGHETRGLKLPKTPHVHVAIATWQWGKYLGDQALQKGIKACIASFRRPDVSSSLPWAKLSGNYLNSIMARREAALAGYDEAILLDQQGFVAEGSGENIFIVENGALLTPLTGAILPGITRDAIISLARSLGLSVSEQPLTRNRLYEADEVFFTGTAAEVTPVTSIDGRPIASGLPGPVSLRLASSYEAAVKGELTDFGHWLSFV